MLVVGVADMVRVQVGKEIQTSVDGILRALGGPETVDEVTVFVSHEVLGGDELIACSNNGGLEVALECLYGLNLWAKRVHGSSKK